MTSAESDVSGQVGADHHRDRHAQHLTEPGTESGRAALSALLGDPGGALLAVDFDGVLAPIVDDPDKAHVHPAALPVLCRLAARLRAVAVVTGRPVEQALSLGGFDGAEGLDDLVILGQYGVERWEARSGETTAPEPPPGIETARRRVPGLLAELGLTGAQVEDKGRALGLHVRRLPEPDDALERLRGPVEALAAELDLHVEPGKHVLELRARGFDKGGAIESLLAETAATAVVYAGDDVGDIAAFDAVERYREGGGHGLLIWSEADEAQAEARTLGERADLVLGGPDGVLAWFEAVADRLDGL
jgi:trehalose 6-phosphate phosphatase